MVNSGTYMLIELNVIEIVRIVGYVSHHIAVLINVERRWCNLEAKQSCY
jgi:hypothetical protein